MRDEAPHRYLDVASSELERAIVTLQHLLQVSKPDLDDEKYGLINMCSELEYTLYLFQDQTYRVQVLKEFFDTDCEVYGKRNQIKKVLFNLLKNSFEAISDTGTITIKHWLDRNYVHISIADTGNGIESTSLPLLGTPFFSTKENGVGMGLTQVYSTVYEHGGSIEVTSVEGQGTTFTLRFPTNQLGVIGGSSLEFKYEAGQSFKAFFIANQELIHDYFQKESPNGFAYMKDNDFPSDPLFTVLDNLFDILIDGNTHELIVYAGQLGRNAAKEDHPMVLILELTEALRQTLWFCLYQYHRHVTITEHEVFELERKYNQSIDRYITHYVSSYMEYKNDILKSHREVIDELSVPVIPLSATQAILPLVGTVDSYRAKRIQEKALSQIALLKIEHIIIDVSGVAFLDTAVVSHLFRIIEGINLLGCSATITGIRPEIANTMVALGISLTGKVEIKGSLQQALNA